MRILFLTCLICMLSSQLKAEEGYADLVETLMPSVVNVYTEKNTVESMENVDNLMLNAELSGRESLGSGFFVRQDGYVLTNFHVIDKAKKISVLTENGKDYEAEIIGVDKASDLAVLKIKNSDKGTFKAVVFGDANKSRVGDKILVFGNPYGLGISVSQGIISAKSRNIGESEQQYIQTDAPINQGNSGGPMFNLDGEVIGVNAVILRMKGTNGIGFSIPSNTANWIVNQLINNGKVQRGWIGMSVAYGMDQYTEKSGFVITEINENSNAYKEGLRVGDVIISYNDKKATDLGEFKQFTEIMEPGQALRLKTISLGEEIRNVIRVQEMPVEQLKKITNEALAESNQYYHQELANGNSVYISELNIVVTEAETRGLIITKIDKKSPLSEKGVEEGDIILEADRTDVYSADNLLESLQNAIVDNYRPLSLLIQGKDNAFYVTVEVNKEND